MLLGYKEKERGTKQRKCQTCEPLPHLEVKQWWERGQSFQTPRGSQSKEDLRSVSHWGLEEQNKNGSKDDSGKEKGRDDGKERPLVLQTCRKEKAGPRGQHWSQEDPPARLPQAGGHGAFYASRCHLGEAREGAFKKQEMTKQSDWMRNIYRKERRT